MKNALEWLEARNIDVKLVALVVFAVIVAVCSQCPGPNPQPVTAKQVVHEADAYAELEARSAAQIDAAWREADAARARSDSASAAARRADVRASVAQHRADSLANSIASAVTPHDSSETWKAAYTERTAEAIELRSSRDSARGAITEKEKQLASITRVTVIQNTLKQKADGVIRDAVNVAKAESCSVPGTFGLLDCPSRRTAFVVGAVGGVLVVTQGPRAARWVIGLVRPP